ncbi:hypothetical protein D3C81_1443910 [compost metagenome]
MKDGVRQAGSGQDDDRRGDNDREGVAPGVGTADVARRRIRRRDAEGEAACRGRRAAERAVGAQGYPRRRAPIAHDIGVGTLPSTGRDVARIGGVEAGSAQKAADAQRRRRDGQGIGMAGLIGARSGRRVSNLDRDIKRPRSTGRAADVACAGQRDPHRQVTRRYSIDIRKRAAGRCDAGAVGGADRGRRQGRRIQEQIGRANRQAIGP